MAAAITVKVLQARDATLQRKLSEWAAITGRTVKEETRTAFRSMVRFALRYNPPASANASGKDAQRQGQAAIARDLKLMGFVPKTLKGHRIITKAFGRPIKPVSVPTKENPKFEEPNEIHLARLLAKGAARKPSRGGSQAYYVSQQKFNAMVKRLFAEIGKLASGWVNAANQLDVNVPAWIARHGGGRGSQLQVVETTNKLTMRVTNRYPDSAPADEMIRRLDVAKRYEIGNLHRQIDHNLGRNLRAVH